MKLVQFGAEADDVREGCIRWQSHEAGPRYFNIRPMSHSILDELLIHPTLKDLVREEPWNI